MKKAIFTCLGIFATSACVTRAPSDYELDRRAGLLPTLEVEKAKNGGTELYRTNAGNKEPAKPLRASPWFERVWVYSQELDGGYWMQGTYVFLEVEPGHWLTSEEEGK